MASPVQNCPLCRCAIKTLAVTCAHGRKPSPSGVLQVVQDRSYTKKIFEFDGTRGESMKDPEAKAIAKCFGDKSGNVRKTQKGAQKVKDKMAIKFSIIKKSAQGKKDEKITAKVTNNKAGGKKAWCINKSGSASKSEWRSGSGGSKGLPARTDGGVFSGKATGTRYFVHGKGCNDITKRVIVEVFPSQQYEVSVGAAFLGGWADKINSAWDKWGNGILGANAPFTLELKLDPPVGSLGAVWGWEEETGDWRVFYGVKLEGKMDPIIGVKMEFSVSLVVIAAGAWGIPPAASKLLAKHLADISVGVEAGVKIGLAANCQWRWYTDGKRKTVGQAMVTGTGSIGIFLRVTIGSEYVAKVEVKGTLKSEIVVEGKLEASEDGVKPFTTGKIPPAQVIVSIKGTAFLFFSRTKEKAWKLWKNDVVIWDCK